MRILVFGAGVIGSLYGALLAEAGYDVSVYARERRLESLLQDGLLYKSRGTIRLTRGYFEAAVRNGSLYCAGDKQEGYFIFETPETKRTLYSSLLQAKWSLRAFGLKKGIRYVKEIMNSGTYLASEFGKQKKPFTKIEFIAVAQEHQGHGYMRQMMEYAFSESGRLGLPLILTKDDPKKVKLYEHFGMKMVREHIVSDRAVYYEMILKERGWWK